MNWTMLLAVVVTSVLNTVQSGCNATLVKTIRSPVWASIAVFVAALLTTVVVALASGQRLPSMVSIQAVPWWGWIGGAFGAMFILSLMVAAPRLGAGVFTGVTVTAGIITSLVMDHFGLLGFEEHRASVARIAGGTLMVVGLGLIAKG